MHDASILLRNVDDGVMAVIFVIVKLLVTSDHGSISWTNEQTTTQYTGRQDYTFAISSEHQELHLKGDEP